jgi:two-component system nitrate/nitrite sensor histidine kinase NarX
MAVLRKVGEFLASRAILLLLVAGFLAVALVGVVGMSASVMVAVNVQGSGSAINVAGSLRRLTHRVSAFVLADALDRGVARESIDDAITQLEVSMAHPALLDVLKRDESGAADAVYRGVISKWHAWLKPELLALVERPEASVPVSAADYRRMLADVDEFVEQLNTLVAVLEHDAEARIAQLRSILAVALFVVATLVIAALMRMRRRVFLPLADLRSVAGRIAQRDFSARSAYTGTDELGAVGQSFNTMAAELSAAYRELEHRVARKTADLQRSNQSLELLYHVITRLYHAPASAESYAETLADIERTLGLKGSFACVQSKHGGAAAVLFSTLQSCDTACEGGTLVCDACPGRSDPWTYRSVGDRDELLVPLRDADNLYGILRLAVPRGHRLEPWQTTLLEAVSRHMGVALGITRQSERERLLALQEERSAIARELHDSLAQSLSFMKIQVSLLSPMLGDATRGGEAAAIVADLREGINSAYRQLRELLSSFRLRMDGDFVQVMQATADEFADRSGLPVEMHIRLGNCSLTPNQEVHLLHIVREALSNAIRHAEASRIWVTLAADEAGEVVLEVRDDGKGVGHSPTAERHHYGLTIMAERANSLNGCFHLGEREGGGTRLEVRFRSSPPGLGETRVVTFAP